MQNQTLTESLAAFDPEIYGLLQEEIQKQRFTLSLPKETPKDEVEKIVMANDQTAKYLAGNAPKKVIVVPKKIVNIVF